jgi:hypothetical protein
VLSARRTPGSPDGNTSPAGGRTAEFVDPANGERFAEHGFVVVDLLTADEVALLRDRWHALARRQPPVWDPTGLSATVRHPGLDEEADAAIDPVVTPAIRRHVRSHVPFMSTFLVKSAGSGELPAHLDWRLVPEPDEISLGCWVPLEDVSAANGGLGVYPGSHLEVAFDRTPESPGHDWVESYAKRRATATVLELRMGEAVVYDHRLVHYSPTNQAGTPRLATNSGMAAAGSTGAARALLLDMMRRGMTGSTSAPQIPDGPA